MNAGLFTAPNTKYSYYQLSFNHPTLGAFYNDFCEHYGLSRVMGMGDKQRIQYEKLLWEYLRKLYRRFNPNLGKLLPKYEEGRHLSENLMGYPEEAFNDFLLRVMDLPKAFALFYKTYPKELEELAKALKPSDTYIKWKRGDL